MSKLKKNKTAYKPDLIGEIDQSISWIFIILLGVLPLLVRATVIDFTAPLLISSVVNSGPQGDSFSYYKWVFMIAMTLAAIFFLLLKC